MLSITTSSTHFIQFALWTSQIPLQLYYAGKNSHFHATLLHFFSSASDSVYHSLPFFYVIIVFYPKFHSAPPREKIKINELESSIRNSHNFHEIDCAIFFFSTNFIFQLSRYLHFAKFQISFSLRYTLFTFRIHKTQGFKLKFQQFWIFALIPLTIFASG